MRIFEAILNAMKQYILCLMVLANLFFSAAQTKSIVQPEALVYRFQRDSTLYVKATVLGQFWTRYNANNPGSTVYGTPESNAFDIGIRRARFSLMSQFTKGTFFYAQVGLNNLNSLSARKSGLFIHDFTIEQKLFKEYVTLGTGLSGWSGTSRYASSSIGTLLSMDLPSVQETTNDISDQFGRKFGIFVKGEIHQLAYRVTVAKPFPVQNALGNVEQLPANVQDKAYFSTKSPKLNVASYVYWQFLDKEQGNLPYMTGSYLGSKKVLNLGAGFQLQKDAFWFRNSTLDTVSVPLKQLGIDVFYDTYLNADKRNAITVYGAFLHYDFGPNYVRNTGVFNVANGTNSAGSFNGPGNAMPLIGTGNVVYAQAAYLFHRNLLGKLGTLQPYSAITYAKYKGLANDVKVYNIGINWLFVGHASKLSLDYQSRPVFYTAMQEIKESKSARRGQIVLQYQLSF